MATPDATDGAARPTSLREAHEVMRDTAADGARLLFRGAGTKLGWGGEPALPDVVVDTTQLDRVLAHNAGDMTAVMQAGVPLARLQEQLADAGQWLAIDPPAVDDGATVGGIVATGDGGPRRLRYGAVRDLVIGMTVILSDGVVARSGSQVIKNVAGYDLGKLFCGSFGTLGFVAEVVVRLHPLPAASGTVRVPAGAQAATRLMVEMRAAPLDLSAIEWAEDALWVRTDGTERGVRAQLDSVGRLAARSGLDGEVLRDVQEAEAWRRLTRLSSGEPGQTVARAGTRPSRLADVAEALDRAAEGGGVTASLSSSAGIGLHTALLDGADAAAHAAAVRSWRDAVGKLGGTVTLRRRVDGLDELVDAWGPPPSPTPLMARIREQLDPQGRCAPGRFAPWF